MVGLYLEVLFRTVVAYTGLLVLTRFTGRREINQLTFPDFTSALAVGTVAANLSFGTHRAVTVLLFCLVVWIALTVFLDLAALKNRRVRVVLEGGPTVVVHNGKLLEDRMGKLRYSVDDLMSQMREKGVFHLSEVEFAVIEPSGRLSILKKGPHRPVTPADLSIPTQYQGIGVTVIGDGQIRDRNLEVAGLTRAWLLGELERRGLTLDKVVLAQLDSAGHLYIDLRKDQPLPASRQGWTPPVSPKSGGTDP